MRRVLLVDGNHLASRCRHSQVSEMRCSDGSRSGVIYGVLRGLQWARNQLAMSWSQLVVCWDDGRADGRTALYPEYKAGRKKPETDADLQEQREYYSQIASVISGLSLLGTKSVRVRGVEADDLISIFANQLQAGRDSVVVYTGDKDLHQLVSDNVQIFDPDKGVQKYEAVLSEWGVSHPSRIPVLKSIIGDKSDNITGVPQIGPKRAALILPFAGMIFTDDDVSHLPGKVSEYLSTCRTHREIVYRNYKLVCLPTDWAFSYYTAQQRDDAVAQFNGTSVRNISGFLQFCRRYQLDSILEQINAW